MPCYRAFLTSALDLTHVRKTHNAERPLPFATSSRLETVNHGFPLYLPRGGFDFNHIDSHDQLIRIEDSSPIFIEDATSFAPRSALTGVETGDSWIFGGAGGEKRIGQDTVVYLALVSVHMDWRVEMPSDLFHDIFPSEAPYVQEEHGVERIVAHDPDELVDCRFFGNHVACADTVISLDLAAVYQKLTEPMCRGISCPVYAFRIRRSVRLLL